MYGDIGIFAAKYPVSQKVTPSQTDAGTFFGDSLLEKWVIAKIRDAVISIVSHFATQDRSQRSKLPFRDSINVFCFELPGSSNFVFLIPTSTVLEMS